MIPKQKKDDVVLYMKDRIKRSNPLQFFKMRQVNKIDPHLLILRKNFKLFNFFGLYFYHAHT